MMIILIKESKLNSFVYHRGLQLHSCFYYNMQQLIYVVDGLYVSSTMPFYIYQLTAFSINQVQSIELDIMQSSKCVPVI